MTYASGGTADARAVAKGIKAARQQEAAAKAMGCLAMVLSLLIMLAASFWGGFIFLVIAVIGISIWYNRE